MTHAEFMKELLTSYQAGRTLDEEAKAKILKEADKDLQAERARLIPVVAEARETALEMGLIEADDDILEFADLDPHRVESEYSAKFLAEALGADSFDEKLLARINADRVQADRAAQSLGDAYRSESTNEELLFQVDPHRVRIAHTPNDGLGTAFNERLFSQMDPLQIEPNRAAELLADALGIASIDEELLTQLDPVRVRIDPLKNPWASTRVRFTINARSTTKAQSREILRRDCWCCSTPGCCNRIWLHIHHLESYSKGGKTEPGNLIGLCSACHKNTHDGLLKIERQADGRLLFFDQFGNRLDRQVDLHIAEWLDYEIGWTGGETNSYKARCGIDWAVFAS